MKQCVEWPLDQPHELLCSGHYLEHYVVHYATQYVGHHASYYLVIRGMINMAGGLVAEHWVYHTAKIKASDSPGPTEHPSETPTEN